MNTHEPTFDSFGDRTAANINAGKALWVSGTVTLTSGLPTVAYLGARALRSRISLHKGNALETVPGA